MAIFPIRRFSDPVLRMAASGGGRREVGRLIDDMIETMGRPGRGAGRPQIGIGLRAVVLNAGDGPTPWSTLLEETRVVGVRGRMPSVPNRHWPIKAQRASGLDRGRPVPEGDELLGR
jgi:hypothetical protein